MSEPRKDQSTGTWYFVEESRSSSGARRQVKRRGFATKRAANDARKALLSELAHGTLADPSRLTVGEYLVEQWLPSLAGKSLARKTVDEYDRSVRVHLVPNLGGIKLQALELVAVEGMLAELAREGLSPKTRRNVHGILSKALADALRWRLVSRNAASGVELPKVAARPPRAWSAETLGAFLEHVDGDRLAPLWRFLVVSGVRRGEALGLRWNDVDLEAGLVTITNNRVVARGGIDEKGPKSRAGNRTFGLDPTTIASLRSWRSAQRLEHVALGVRPETAYVFTGPLGGPLNPTKTTARFRELCDELGLERIGVQGLRHSAATWLVASGESPKLVAQRLGHDVTVCLRTYAHVAPGRDLEAASRFAAAFDSRDQTVTTERVSSL